MPDARTEKTPARPKGPNLLALLQPYRGLIAVLAVLTVVGNALNLAVPKIVSNAIDAFTAGRLVLRPVAIELAAVAVGIFVFLYLQSVVQTLASERVARDLRTRLVEKISRQDHAFIQRVTPATLLTNLTSDIDAVKMFIAQAVASLIASVFLIVGASILLLSINWKLGLAVLTVLPIIGGTFNVVLRRVRKLFVQAQQAIDWLNKVINESILGSALIRLVNSERHEYGKFVAASGSARDISLSILRLFAALIPVITFCVNLATLMILTMGGRYVIRGSMSLGDFSAFNGYLSILVFPVIMIGFMSNVMAQAGASYMRLSMVLNAPDKKDEGTVVADLRGDVAVRQVDLTLAGKRILKNVSIEVRAGTRTAVIGPTAAGKTQLLYLLTGLLKPTSGTVEYDGRTIDDYQKEHLHAQIGFVFQDTIVFNLTLRENIAFSKTVKDEDLEKAIATAELQDFIASLPARLDTVVSERGTSLSGGQKQRVMLARALALNPRVLLLDDFTARVDSTTERQILGNVRRNYPGITVISVTQKVAAVEDYDQIVVLMEGEVLASGTHPHLMATSPEYVQIYDSQRSTSHYELLRAQ
ncbi:MAG TPA: ABC transporter ATP-binding protein [Vicinamibacterales bacterium]|nr:ABC transporter ATP-binding protein [Vicinamibacterales bacterium]